MKSATVSNTALKRENASASANVLMCKQWWKVCWMYGDQEKYYRQLYGKRGNGMNFQKNIADNKKGYNSGEQTELPRNFYENTNQSSPVNSSFNFEEIRSPSPSKRRNSSPGLLSLDLTRGLDE